MIYWATFLLRAGPSQRSRAAVDIALLREPIAHAPLGAARAAAKMGDAQRANVSYANFCGSGTG